MISKHLVKISAAAVMALSFGGASAQLADVGPTFGASTFYGVNGGAATSSYAPGRRMTYNGGSAFDAFCIDPGTGTALPSAYATMSLDSFLDGTATSAYQQQMTRSGYATWPGLSTSSATQLVVKNDLKELFSYAYNDATTGTAASIATKAAAFGMAVWEIILQDGTNGTTYAKGAGRLSTFGSTSAADSDAIEAQTTVYLNALNTGGWAGIGLGTATNWSYTVFFDAGSPFSQSFIRVTTPGVPEPGTAALAALALLGAVRFSRRNPKV